MTFEAHLKRTTRAQTRESSVRERHEVAAVEIGLNAAILAVQKDEPVVLVVRSQDETGQAIEALPFGPFSPLEHRTLEIGLRKWVSEQTGSSSAMSSSSIHSATAAAMPSRATSARMSSRSDTWR